MCLFSGLSAGFLVILAAYSRDFSIFLSSGGGLNARFWMLSIGFERKTQGKSYA